MSFNLSKVTYDRPRIGILGGTFDPVHVGHKVIAGDAAELMRLDRLYFIPTAQNPLKSCPPLAAAEHRLAMLELLCAAEESWDILAWEIEAGGKSYTIDTVTRLRNAHAQAQLFWIIGADQVADLARWHRIHELAAMIEFIVFARPGHVIDTEEPVPGIRIHEVAGRQVGVSATEIRRRLGQRKPVDMYLPNSVSRYIQVHALYR